MCDVRFAASLALIALITLMAPHANAQSPTTVEAGLSAENQAFITQIGEGQRAAIEQTNIHGGLLTAAIQQNGVGNNASISLEGGDLFGSVTQIGDGNQAVLEIRDEHNRGTIEQYGHGNSAGLQIEGYGREVTVIQEGNGNAYSGPIKVSGDTPGGPITIRQHR